MRRGALSGVAVAGLALLSGCALGQPKSATYVTDLSATLNGNVYSTENAGVEYASDHAVEYWFEYGTGTGFASQTPHRTLHLAAHQYRDAFPVSEPIAGLDADTTYHFRMCADDAQPGVGPGCTGDVSFHTSATAGRSGIAFSSADAIWTMDPDGGNKTNLDDAGGNFEHGYPSWAPDATRLAYIRGAFNDVSDVWAMDADGGNRVQLTDTTAAERSPAWSPDGSKIAFVSDPVSGDVWVMDADGGNPVNLTSSAAVDRFPAWSPDGSRIAWARNASDHWEIWVMDADGGNPHAVITAGDAITPSWSPDGQRIAYSSSTDGGATSHIVVADANGGNAVALTSGTGTEAFPTWSPSGSQIAYYKAPGDIYVMDADGGNQTDLTNTPSIEDIWPAWSPRP